MNIYLLVLTLSTFLVGCVSMDVSNISSLNGSEEVCIKTNDSVRTAFLEAYERRINANGYRTRIISTMDDASCGLITTYTAKYGQHWGTYLAHSELEVYRNNKLVGSAKYHAPFMSMGKHGRVENKIGSMVNEMLPKL